MKDRIRCYLTFYCHNRLHLGGGGAGSITAIFLPCQVNPSLHNYWNIVRRHYCVCVLHPYLWPNFCILCARPQISLCRATAFATSHLPCRSRKPLKKSFHRWRPTNPKKRSSFAHKRRYARIARLKTVTLNISWAVMPSATIVSTLNRKRPKHAKRNCSITSMRSTIVWPRRCGPNSSERREYDCGEPRAFRPTTHDDSSSGQTSQC